MVSKYGSGMAAETPETSGQIQRMQAKVKTLIDDDLVAVEEHRLTHFQHFVHFWMLVFQNFIRNRCPVRASALAYTTLLAVVPLLAVSISVAALFLPKEEARQRRVLEDLIDAAINKVAPAVGVGIDDPSSPSSPEFSADDYSALRILTERVSRQSDPVSKYLWERLSPAQRELTVGWDGTDAGRMAVEHSISEALNAVLTDSQFYSKERFSQIPLSPSVLSLMSPTNANKDLRHLNRLLLESAYPKEIIPMIAPNDPSNPGRARRSELAGKIVEFVGNIRFGTIGASAMAGLLFVAISLLRTVESAFNDIWGIPKGRTWFMSIVLYWAVITLGPIAIVVAKGANYIAFLHLTNTGSTWTILSEGVRSLSWLLTLAVMSLAFAGLYLWMPNTRVQWQAALLGGAVAAALWTLNGRISALYNSKVVTYNAIYGSLGVVPLFLLGMYLSWLILLFGAQTAYVYQFRKAYLQERLAGRVHHQAREFIALRLMTHVGERFRDGAKPLTATQLAEQLAIPPKLAKDVLNTLVATGLLVETSGVEVGYLPARPLEQITAWEILHSIRAGLGHDVHTLADESRMIVRAEFEEIIAAEALRARSTTVQNIIERTQGLST